MKVRMIRHGNFLGVFEPPKIEDMKLKDFKSFEEFIDKEIYGTIEALKMVSDGSFRAGINVDGTYSVKLPSYIAVKNFIFEQITPDTKHVDIVFYYVTESGHEENMTLNLLVDSHTKEVSSECKVDIMNEIAKVLGNEKMIAGALDKVLDSMLVSEFKEYIFNMKINRLRGDYPEVYLEISNSNEIITVDKPLINTEAELIVNGYFRPKSYLVNSFELLDMLAVNKGLYSEISTDTILEIFPKIGFLKANNSSLNLKINGTDLDLKNPKVIRFQAEEESDD